MVDSEKYPVPILPEFTGKEITVASRDSIDGLLHECHGKQKNVIHPLSLLTDIISNTPSNEIIELTDEVSDNSDLSDAYANESILNTLCSSAPLAKEAESPKKTPPNGNNSFIGRLKDWIRRG